MNKNVWIIALALLAWTLVAQAQGLEIESTADEDVFFIDGCAYEFAAANDSHGILTLQFVSIPEFFPDDQEFDESGSGRGIHVGFSGGYYDDNETYVEEWNEPLY